MHKLYLTQVQRATLRVLLSNSGAWHGVKVSGSLRQKFRSFNIHLAQQTKFNGHVVYYLADTASRDRAKELLKC